jgi:glucan-binding repeat-containing protein
MDIDTSRNREGLPQVGVQPYRQVHAHSTGNRNSTAQNEADYHYRKDPELGFFSHVVGNGRVMQVGPVNNGSWDVGGGWNAESYAAVELIESHGSKEEFMRDYKLYVELLRNLADEAGLPKTLDTGSLAGIKTHEYCTNNQPNNHSDHVDPYPYLAKWGISREQFKKDIEDGLSESGWKRNETGWWWEESDGSYPTDRWKKVNNEWFYFNERGYCLINRWFNDGKDWFYLDKRGAMVTGWMYINNRWYYFKSDGRMAKGWVKYRETWYYLDEKDGDMKSDQFVKYGNGWYYLKPDGSMADKPEFTVEPDGLITTK